MENWWEIYLTKRHLTNFKNNKIPLITQALWRSNNTAAIFGNW